MNTSHPSKDRRQDLCTANVTVNGRRAQISGWKNDFATVTDLRTGFSAQWAWSTVDFVVAERGGKFRA